MTRSRRRIWAYGKVGWKKLPKLEQFSHGEVLQTTETFGPITSCQLHHFFGRPLRWAYGRSFPVCTSWNTRQEVHCSFVMGEITPISFESPWQIPTMELSCRRSFCQTWQDHSEWDRPLLLTIQYSGRTSTCVLRYVANEETRHKDVRC